MGKIYATWNPDDKSSYISLSNGNLTALSSTIPMPVVRATISQSTGKHYWEITRNTTGADIDLGVYDDNAELIGGITDTPHAHLWRINNGIYYFSVNSYSVGHTASSAANDVLMFAADFDNNKIWFGKNGTWNEGDPATNTGYSLLLHTDISYFPTACIGNSQQITANFGAAAFAYTPPDGFNEGFYLDTTVYVLSGTVKKGATPLQRTVRVKNHSDKSLVGEQVSGVDGTFSFDTNTYPLLTSGTYDIFAYGDDTAELGKIMAFGNVTPIET